MIIITSSLLLKGVGSDNVLGRFTCVIGGFYSIGPSSLELPNTRDNRMCLRMSRLKETCSFDLNEVMGEYLVRE